MGEVFCPRNVLSIWTKLWSAEAIGWGSIVFSKVASLSIGGCLRRIYLVPPIFLFRALKVLNVSGPHRGPSVFEAPEKARVNLVKKSPRIKPRSPVVTYGNKVTTSKSMLPAVGMGHDDWLEPQIGFASPWNEATPRNLS